MSKPENDSISEPISTRGEIDCAAAALKGVELVRKAILEAGQRAHEQAAAERARQAEAKQAEAKHLEQLKKELHSNQPVPEKPAHSINGGSDDY